MKLIRLDASLSSDLNWEFSSEEDLFWHLDFGWDNASLDPYNPLHFNSYLLAVEEFCKSVPESAMKVVFAVSDGDFSKIFVSSDKLESGYHEFLLEKNLEASSFYYRLFCANLFSEYLHRLASALSEEKEPFILFSISEPQDLAEMILLLSRRRFEHFQLIFSDWKIPVIGEEAKVGICLPQDEKYLSDEFCFLFASLESPYICIPEELLNEHWGGLDYLLFHPKRISDTGYRMLQGFEAAGGKTLSLEGAQSL